MAHRHLFSSFAEKTAKFCGSPVVFAMACATIVGWGLLGPIFGFSDSWQLVINTGTTIITFLMVFLIQNTQHRDARAVQLKLDELLRATQGAHLGLMDLERLDEAELEFIQDKYLALAKAAHERLQNGGDDCDTPELTL